MSAVATAAVYALSIAAGFLAADEELMRRIGVLWTWEHLVAVLRRCCGL